MRHRHLILIVAGISILLASLPARTAERGFADAALGRWDITVRHPDGDYPSWLEVSLRTEGELQGRFVGRFGSVRYLPSVEYRDGVLAFQAPSQYEGFDLFFTGRVDGDRITGTTFDRDGSTLEFSAARAPELMPEVSRRGGRAVQLFDGESLAGWRYRTDQHTDCWAVDDGLLTVTPPCVDIVTEDAFDDFRLEVEFRYPEGSNSGIYLRGRYEVQIQDDHGKALDPLRIGGVYGFIAPPVDAAKPAGEWQRYRITLRGRVVTVELNDIVVIDSQVIPGITGGALDSNEGEPGPILLQGDHGPIEFRKVALTPL